MAVKAPSQADPGLRNDRLRSGSVGLEGIPVGTGYAVWVGIGATLTVAYAMATGAEPMSVARLLLLAGLVGCVIGLRVLR